MNRITKAIDLVVELGDQLLEAAKWDADTVREHIVSINRLAPAWRSAVQELRAANEVLLMTEDIDISTCTRCGLLTSEVLINGDEKLCIICTYNHGVDHGCMLADQSPARQGAAYAAGIRAGMEQLQSDVTHTAELNCPCCGMLFRVDLPTTGVVQLVNPGFAREVVLQEGIWKGRAQLLESTWEDGDEWAASTSDDFDPCYTGTTRDEAIADAIAGAEHGDSCVYVGKVRYVDPRSLITTADDLVEAADERLWDLYSVDGSRVGVTDEAKSELEALLASWARRHIGRTVYEVVGKTEEIDIDWCPGDCGELATECRCAHQAALGVLGSRLYEMLGDGWAVAAAKEGARVSDQECFGVLVKAKVEQLLELGVTLVRKGGER